MKAAGAHWDCYYSEDFTGWEADNIVVLTFGSKIMELITRARCQLSFILVGKNFDGYDEKEEKRRD